VLERLEIEVCYEGYLRRQEADAAKVARADGVLVPTTIDYRDIPGLSNEAVEKLEAIRPRSVGQASRISGVTPAAVAILLTHIGLVERRKAEVGSRA
jgi:tRNA uridine 5-carboxymethylaminomethyl modification enzyme